MNSLSKCFLGLTSHYLRGSSNTLGRWRLHDWALETLRENGKNMGKKLVRSRYGFLFNADLIDWLGQYVYVAGTYEPATASVIAKLLKPGDSFFDVGANVGFFTLLAASRVGKTGKVNSFEPVPSVRSSLESNIAVNGFGNVTVHAKAVSNSSGTVVINEGPTDHKGLSSMRPLDSASGQHKIDAVALDDIADSLGKVQLIKIDVEGAELLALQGMTKLLKRDRPFIVIEFTDSFLKSFGHSDAMLREFLTENGYTLWLIGDTNLTALEKDFAKLPPQFNVLCSPTIEPPFINIAFK